MKLKFFLILFLITLIQFRCTRESQTEIKTDVLVVGGGASGTMAGIQAARMGVNAVIVEETPWLGGMLTSAGVSAIDGNYRLHSGLWEEFRQQLYNHYGGPDSVNTGWVSGVLFEPQVGAKILEEMTLRESSLTVYKKSKLKAIKKSDQGWKAVISGPLNNMVINVRIVIDATELGDVAKSVGIDYDIGMDSRNDFGEEIAPEDANNVIQDLTYVAVLKDYGPDADMTIDMPDGYDASMFYCTCAGRCDEDSVGRTLWPCETMMTYGKLPNDHYMINWPIYGNDYYLNIIDSLEDVRQSELQKAKNHTLCYLYYIQTELGFNNLGLADNVFPTEDGLPFIPYHRESRRIKGLVRFNINDLAKPFEQEQSLYRTGIAVGDYPVDHHHHAYPDFQSLPDLHFYPVPSYSLPLGTLIPENVENFIVAEKSISVTNLVNGTTRLQPVCMLIGHAAGTLAALAVKRDISPGKVPIREVQRNLLATGAFIMPYSDVDISRPTFDVIQRIGATGLLKGEGKTIGWANHTHIHPDSVLTYEAIVVGLDEWANKIESISESDIITVEKVLRIIRELGLKNDQPCGKMTMEELKVQAKKLSDGYDLKFPESSEAISREMYAVLLDGLFGPFTRPIDHFGNYIK